MRRTADQMPLHVERVVNRRVDGPDWAFMPRGFWPNGDKNDNGESVLNLQARRRIAFDYRDDLGLGELAFLQ